MNKKGIAPIIIILIVLVGLIIFAPQMLNLASLEGAGDYIERPIFKYVKCEPSSVYTYSDPETFFYGLSSDKGGFWIPAPSNTNKYDVRITTTESSFFFPERVVEYYICNSQRLAKENCRIPDRENFDRGGFIAKINRQGEVLIPNVRSNERVLVQYQKVYSLLPGFPPVRKATSGALWQVGFVPYGLREYNVLGGGAGGFINPNQCIALSSSDDSWRDRFLSTDSKEISNEVNKIKGTYEKILQPEEVRWYVSGYLTSIAPSFALNYKGQEAWCRQENNFAKIYKINTITLGSGTYKIASLDWNDELGIETCCPTDKKPGQTCNKQFQWESTEKTECSVFNSCDGGSYTPYDPQTIARYLCIEGKCKLEVKKVDCANDLDCKDTNQLCDKRAWKCVEGDVNLKGQKIQTIPDNIQKCEKEGGTWISQQTQQSSFWNYLGIGEPKIILKEYCEMSKGFFGAQIKEIFIIGLLIVLFFIAFPYLKTIFITIRRTLRM